MGVRIAQAQNTGSSGRSPKTLSGSASRSRARLHLGQAGPEDQVLSEWLKTTPSRENEPGDGPRVRNQRPGEPFSGPILPPPVVQGMETAPMTGSPWLSERPGTVFRAGSGARPP